MSIVISQLIQDRVEKSIFEKLRLVLVAEGYLPDITNIGRFPDNAVGQSTWESDLKIIEQAKAFASEVFGHGTSQDKGIKRVPRISILSGRFTEGEIGTPINGQIVKNPEDPNNYVKLISPLESSTLNLEIALTTNSSDQDRVLHYVLLKALGNKRMLTFYDNPKEYFFIKQSGYYESPDLAEGIEEKIYIFEVRDLYIHQEQSLTPVPLINEITIETLLTDDFSNKTDTNGNIIGPFIRDGKIFMDLSGITFSLPE